MRKIYLTILLIGLVCLCGSYSFADDTSLVVEGRALLFNDGNFTYSGIVAANVKFGQAVAADPSDQEANLFYAVTRVGAFALEQGSGSGLETLRDLYEAFGITRNSNDSLPDSPVDLPPAGLTILPDTAPDGEPVRAFLAGPFVDLLDDALAKLSFVTSSFTTTITAAETGDTAVEVDYGDVLLLRSAFHALKGLFLFVSSYDLDIDLHDIMAKYNMGVFQIQRDLLDEYPNLLKLRSTDGSTSLTNARQAFINGIDAYREAYDFIASESDLQGDDLFFFGSQEEQDEANDLLTQLTEAENSLNQNRAATIGDTNIDFNLVFGNTGKSQLDIRSILPEFDEDDDILAGTFPGSPILNGIFPDITTEKDLAQAADLKLVYDVPTGHRVGLCDQDCQANTPLKVSGDELDVCFNYTGPVNILAGVLSDDFRHIWWLGPDCSLDSNYSQAVDSGNGLSCEEISMPVNGGYLFWLVSPVDLSHLDWENGIYDLLFYQVP